MTVNEIVMKIIRGKKAGCRIVEVIEKSAAERKIMAADDPILVPRCSTVQT